MDPQEMIYTIAKSDTLGFQIAKEYHHWMELDKVQEVYKASDIIYLANMIDNVHKESKESK